MNCKNCNSKKLKKVVHIGDQPLSGVFYKSIKFRAKEYSLNLYKCKKCELVQILKLAPTKKMYGATYGYQTGISNLMTSHLKNKIKYLKKKNFINNASSVLDIGSNDGSFLNFFSKKNFLIGTDPSIKKFKKNYRPFVHTIDNFFSKKNILNFFNKKKIQEKKFNLITSFAIFYDIENPNLFCKDIHELLSKDGVWVSEFSYLPLMLKNLTYDQICHEHIAYYNLKVFNSIIKRNKLKIINVNFNEINGGSIEVICAKNNSKFKENNYLIKRILNDEKKITLKSYKNFYRRINKVKNNLNFFLKQNKSKKIIGYGASTKGNIVLNHCKISNKFLPYICDANKTKINKFTPGTNIKIISKERMRIYNPDFLLVLIWPFRKEVIKQEIKYLKNGGKLIFHLPKLHIINKLNYKKYLKMDFKSMSYSY